MSDRDMLLVAGMASLAVVITLADLLLTLFRRRQKVARARRARPATDTDTSPADTAAAVKREAIRHRLAAIQTTMGEKEEPSAGKVTLV